MSELGKLNVEVRRDIYSTHSTQGRLYIDGQYVCFTLEPPTGVNRPCAIPDGTYPLTIRWSWKFKKHVPHVENVPGFIAIEQHVGNFPEDTEGCTLVGKVRGPQTNYIGLSLMAFINLMKLYFDWAVLTNPDSPEKEHVWNVGTVTYSDARTVPPDASGEISV